jgi:hypothetical protein
VVSRTGSGSGGRFVSDTHCVSGYAHRCVGGNGVPVRASLEHRISVPSTRRTPNVARPAVTVASSRWHAGSATESWHLHLVGINGVASRWSVVGFAR